ncbi:hypothetical protein BE21_07855 [Sorangium cellulosum]|uniref:Glycosyltransferase RgtA/B/C/D-like domain-containing protein n=1 Tax=Sorangium cellulosum TaxID=56 RepID=A0A150U331_SORCE|nr:hypothetical protein BE21_07855 [Sorangium cellulosum]
MPWLLLALIATLVGAWRVACALGLRRTIDIATAFTLVFCVQMMGLALLVGGLLGRLSPAPMLLAALLVAAVEVWLTGRGSIDETRARSAALARDGLGHALRGSSRHPVVAVFGLLVAVQYAWRAALGSFLPASDWDGLVYHVTGPAVWLQQGHIGYTPQQIWADVYPQGQELFIAWIGTFTGSLRLAWTSGMPFFLLGVLSVAGLARTAGAGRAHATLAGLGFLAIPAVLVQASTTYVDVATSTTILAASQMVLAPARVVRPDEPAAPVLRRYLFVAGLALAVGTSIKSYNLLAAALVFCVALAQARRMTRMGTLLPSASALLVVPSLLLSSYWYLRTWLKYGNPLHPFPMMGFEGKLSFDDIMRDNTPPEIWNAHGLLAKLWGSWSADLTRHAFRYDQRLGGFGPQWVYVLLPALLIGLAVFLRRRQWDLLWGLALPLGVLLVAHPGPWWARYTLFLAGLGCVCLAAALDVVRPRIVGTALGAVFACVSALGMWWATDPTHIVGLSGSAWTLLTAGQAVEFMRDPALQERIDPVWGYEPIRRLPDGSAIGATIDGPQHVVLLLGERRQRNVVSLGWSRDIKDLRKAVQESGAKYVLLGSTGADADLYLAAIADAAHFRHLVHDGGVRGFDLFEFREAGDGEVGEIPAGDGPDQRK